MFPSFQDSSNNQINQQQDKATDSQGLSPLERFMSHSETNNPSNSKSSSNQFFTMNHRPLLNEPHGLLKDVEDDISLDGAAPLAPLSHQPEPLDKETRLLKQLDQALAIAVASPSNTTMAFQLAQKICPSLIRDKSFRLMFLRATHEDPSLAAQRMIKFFQHKLQLFGVEKLGKANITMSDLSDEDRNVLYRGRMQVLKEKDQSGKTILCNIVQNGETITNCSSVVSENESKRMQIVR